MKCVLKAGILKKAIKQMSPAFGVGVNPTVAMDNVVITAQKSGLKLFGTNGSIALTVRLDAEVEQTCKAVVSWKQFKEVVSTLKAKHLLEINDVGHISQAIRFLSNNVESVLIKAEPEPKFTIAQVNVRFKADLKPAIEKCLPFVSTEETRHFLNGCALQGIDNHVDVVATDGRTLKAVRLDAKPTEPFDIIVPSEACRVLLKFPDNIRVAIGSARARFHSGNITLATRLMTDGVGVFSTFPDWKAVVDMVKTDWTFSFNRQEAIDALMPFTKLRRVPSWSSVMVRLQLKDDKMMLANKREFWTKATIDAVHDEPYTLAVGAHLFLRCLKSIDTEGVNVEMGKAQSEMSLGGADNETTLLMPMRTGDLWETI